LFDSIFNSEEIAPERQKEIKKSILRVSGRVAFQLPVPEFHTRTLPLFGQQVHEGQINFRWTAQTDAERLGLKHLVKLQEVRVAMKNHCLCGIQLAFTDGIVSPLF